MEMKRSQVFFVFFGFVLSVALNVSTTAGEDPKTLTLLRGVGAVHVQVKDFGPELAKELQKGGLVQDQVQMSVERRLEKAGIRLQSEEAFGKSSNKTVLLVKVDFLMPDAMEKIGYTVEGEQISKGGDSDKYVYRVDVALRQQVSLLRDPAVQGMATTWSTGSVGFRRLMRIHADVMGLVDAFIDAYTAANPK